VSNLREDSGLQAESIYGRTLVEPIELRDDGSTALIIIDMQYRDVPDTNDTTRVDRGWMDALSVVRPGDVERYNSRVRTTVIPAIRQLLSFFRSKGLPVVYTVFGSERGDYSDMPMSLRKVALSLERVSGLRGFVLSTHPGFRIRSEVAPANGELVVRKSTWSSFVGTELDGLLRQRGITNLVITGVSTHACVGATARHAADLGYGCVIVDQATADDDAELHQSSLRLFHRTHGRVVESAGEITKAISRGGPV